MVKDPQGEGTTSTEFASERPTFWTIDELAAYLRLSRKTVYSLAQQGKIPGIRRFNRSIRIYIPAVLEWVAADSRQKRR